MPEYNHTVVQAAKDYDVMIEIVQYIYEGTEDFYEAMEEYIKKRCESSHTNKMLQL